MRLSLPLICALWLLSMPLTAAERRSPAIDCNDITQARAESVEVVGIWSNERSNGEHEAGYAVTLLKVDGKYGGWIENLYGLIGDGGVNYPMVDVSYKPGRHLNFSVYMDGAEDPNVPYQYSMELRRNRADLKIDQYRTEELKGSDSRLGERKAEKHLIDYYVKRALKCR